VGVEGGIDRGKQAERDLGLPALKSSFMKLSPLSDCKL
jgi:hypothetical protein